MHSLELWRCADRMTIFDAVMLSMGNNPAQEYSYHWENKVKESDYYDAFKNLIIGAIQAKKITADIVEPSIYGDGLDPDSACNSGDVEGMIGVNSVIDVQDLKKVYLEKRIINRFFTEHEERLPPYMDKKHPYYSPKLHLAILAHEALTNNPELFKVKRPKTAAKEWLKANAVNYGLGPNVALEPIATVTNWDYAGGPRPLQINAPKRNYRTR